MIFKAIKRFFSKPTPNPEKYQSPLSNTAVTVTATPAPLPPSTNWQTGTDYSALASSFNDFLLEVKTDQNLTPNPSEIFILDSLAALLQGDIPDAVVPRLPDVAMALLKQLADTNISSASIMSYVQQDPALASEVLTLANSAMFMGNTADKITNLEKALTYLGLNNLKSVVTSALMKRLMVVAPIYFKMFGQNLWQHSLDTAHACRILARHYGQGDANNAYLVGLMHDIGKLAIFSLLIKALGQNLDYTPRGGVFSAIVRDHSQRLSYMIASKWGLPDYLLIALEENQAKCSPAAMSTYGFLLNQANLLAEFKAISTKLQKTRQDIEPLFIEYGIPAHLFQQVFSETQPTAS